MANLRFPMTSPPFQKSIAKIGRQWYGLGAKASVGKFQFNLGLVALIMGIVNCILLGGAQHNYLLAVRQVRTSSFTNVTCTFEYSSVCNILGASPYSAAEEAALQNITSISCANSTLSFYKASDVLYLRENIDDVCVRNPSDIAYEKDIDFDYYLGGDYACASYYDDDYSNSEPYSCPLPGSSTPFSDAGCEVTVHSIESLIYAVLQTHGLFTSVVILSIFDIFFVILGLSHANKYAEVNLSSEDEELAVFRYNRAVGVRNMLDGFNLIFLTLLVAEYLLPLPTIPEQCPSVLVSASETMTAATVNTLVAAVSTAIGMIPSIRYLSIQKLHRPSLEKETCRARINPCHIILIPICLVVIGVALIIHSF
jgi:hypothetical protein